MKPKKTSSLHLDLLEISSLHSMLLLSIILNNSKLILIPNSLSFNNSLLNNILKCPKFNHFSTLANSQLAHLFLFQRNNECILCTLFESIVELLTNYIFFSNYNAKTNIKSLFIHHYCSGYCSNHFIRFFDHIIRTEMMSLIQKVVNQIRFMLNMKGFSRHMVSYILALIKLLIGNNFSHNLI